jgi:glycosyltransferase involved in cell wall biosynthesis
MHQPLVSVLIITYNQRDFINETLQSALEQEYENLEVVVSDDASTDGTAEIIREYARKFPRRLVALTDGPRLGITGNSNRALKACRGNYIAFQGGDDVLLPGKISAQVAWMEEDERRVVCTHDVVLFESSTGKTLSYWSDLYRLRNGAGLADILKYGHTCLGPGTAIMVRASCMPVSGFDDRLHAASDIKFIYDCLASGGHFGYVPGVHARYRQHQRNIQRTGRQMLIEDGLKIIELLDADYPDYRHLFPYVKHLYYHSLAVWSIRDGEQSKARSYVREALRNRPSALWKYALIYPATFLPGRLPAMFLDVASRTYKSLKNWVSRPKAKLKEPFPPGTAVPRSTENGYPTGSGSCVKH